MSPSIPDLDDPAARRMQALEELFWAAADMEPDEREAFLTIECAHVPSLRHEVQRILTANERAGTFLGLPLPDVLEHSLPSGNIARWKMLERVGEGGLGVVYRAECVEDGVTLQAAVKILRPGFDSGKFREKFVQERQILAGLDHPGIVRLMDCGADPSGRSFLVMEFVRGEPLDRSLERTDPHLARRLELFEAVCEAVGYLHSRLIVHGDIKPSNVLVTDDGFAKLVDFGAARLLEGDTRLRGEVTRLMLTPQYASPEQKRGEGPSVAGDIYSLGRLFEEMLPPAVQRSDLRYILQRAMAERPSDRYLSVADLLEDLRRWREGLPLRTRPATAAYVTRRFLRRNWAVASLTGLLVVSLASGWWRASAAAAEALRQRQAAIMQERRARESELRATASAQEAVLNAGRLDALVGDLIDDDSADPNILDQQQAAIENSLRRAARSLETLSGPPRWQELSVAWRRVAMILVHRGRFTDAEGPLEKARNAAQRWLRSQPSTASRRNALLVKLCQLRLERQRGTNQSGYRLAHEAMKEFHSLPSKTQAELNGTVWLENARLAVARDWIKRNRLEAVPDLYMEVARNSHARGLGQTRNLAVANLVWSLRRLNRIEDARRWCGVAREWQVAELRIAPFCGEPLTPFTEANVLFPVVVGPLSAEDLSAARSRIDQLVKDRREDPASFRLNITLGRAYARLSEHYMATGQIEFARSSAREAAAIRDLLLSADRTSPVVLNFQRRVETVENALASQ